MLGLLVFYVVLAVVFAYERQWPKCTYWIGAAIITGSVLAMR
jgi:uncharacterized membrane protein (DUF485 family)